MNKKTESNIIIKRFKKAGHGHHGGAWKVAYADFVTAMMVFFLLMWLTASIPEETLNGLGNFFKPTSATEINTSVTKLIIEAKEQFIDEMEIDNSDLKTIMDYRMSEMLKEKYGDTIKVRQDNDGVLIIIQSTEEEKLFEDMQTSLTNIAKAKLKDITYMIQNLPYYISISGHINLGETLGSEDLKWMVSAKRAIAASSALISFGIDPEKIAAIVAKADFENIDVKNLNSYRNRRIQIKLINQDFVKGEKRNVSKKAL